MPLCLERSAQVCGSGGRCRRAGAGLAADSDSPGRAPRLGGGFVAVIVVFGMLNVAAQKKNPPPAPCHYSYPMELPLNVIVKINLARWDNYDKL